LAAWPTIRGPRQPAANELGPGPVRHARLTELDRLAGLFTPTSATPRSAPDLVPRTSRCAEHCRRAPLTQQLARPTRESPPSCSRLTSSYCSVPPREFTTKSPVIITSNEWKPPRKNVAPLQDRGHVLMFQPGAAEVHRKAGTWFDDQEIYQWFAENLHSACEPSLPQYVRARELKAAGMD